jgi:hypothetical protein
MSPTPPPTQAAAPDLVTILQQAVAALQQQIDTKPDTDRLVAEMVRIGGQALHAGGAGVWVTEIPDKPELILEHNLPALQLLVEGVPNKGVTAGVRRCTREAKPLIVPPFFSEADAGAAGPAVDVPVNPTPFELLYVPMRLHGKVGLVLVMAVPPPPPTDTAFHRTVLNFLTRLVGMVEQSLTERHLGLIERDRGISNKLVRFADQVHKHLFLGQVAADISNLSRDILDADRVTVEVYPKLKKKVVAVSNVDEPNKRGTVMQIQRLLFDYVRDRHVPVVLDRAAAKQLVSDPMLQDAAAAYFAACDFDAFLLAPIKADDPTAPVLGVILAEYKASEKAQAHSMLLAEVARLSTGAVSNAIDMESLPLIKPFYAIRELWRKPTSTKRTTALTFTGLVILAIAIIGVIPFDFSIKADCQIRPSAQLSLVAPVEERIVEVPVRAGEHVYTKKQLDLFGPDVVKPLAKFDTVKLELELSKAMTHRAGLQLQVNEAQSKGDQKTVAQKSEEVKADDALIDQLQHQIEQCTVFSPIEGTVLTENVEQKRWSTLKKGEPLMEVASFSDWELVVDVPENEVASVRGALDRAARKANVDGREDEGIEVEYILYPWPDTRYSIHAKGSATLLPASQQSKNANVFRLQVKLDPASLPSNIAMSGVTGRAKVHVGQKPLATQWLRGAVRLLKMTLFF